MAGIPASERLKKLMANNTDFLQLAKYFHLASVEGSEEVSFYNAYYILHVYIILNVSDCKCERVQIWLVVVPLPTAPGAFRRHQQKSRPFYLFLRQPGQSNASTYQHY